MFRCLEDLSGVGPVLTLVSITTSADEFVRGGLMDGLGSPPSVTGVWSIRNIEGMRLPLSRSGRGGLFGLLSVAAMPRCVCPCPVLGPPSTSSALPITSLSHASHSSHAPHSSRIVLTGSEWWLCRAAYIWRCVHWRRSHRPPM